MFSLPDLWPLNRNMNVQNSEIMKFNVMLKTAVQKCTALVIWKQFGWCLMWACMMHVTSLGCCVHALAVWISCLLTKLMFISLVITFCHAYFLFAYCLKLQYWYFSYDLFFSKQCSGEIEHLMPYFFLWSTCGFDNEKIIQFSVHLTELS